VSITCHSTALAPAAIGTPLGASGIASAKVGSAPMCVSGALIAERHCTFEGGLRMDGRRDHAIERDEYLQKKRDLSD
jgi:hypothetical protein